MGTFTVWVVFLLFPIVGRVLFTIGVPGMGRVWLGRFNFLRILGTFIRREATGFCDLVDGGLFWDLGFWIEI